MADPYRLKLKIGQHEFEAEGDPKVVHEQFQAFKELIATIPALPQAPPQVAPVYTPITVLPGPDSPPTQDVSTSVVGFDKIARQEDRIISLTVRPASTQDAILLLLLGQKLMRANDSVTGSEVITGLNATGGISVQRPDRVLEKLARDGDVIAFGEGRERNTASQIQV